METAANFAKVATTAEIAAMAENTKNLMNSIFYEIIET
jgi:hypothetical protein